MSFSSDFSKQLASGAGIVDLMADLGEALNVNPDMLFLGGGNPAHIPEFESLVAKHLVAITQDPAALHKLIGIYQSPQGSEILLRQLADYFQQLGWPVSEKNICITGGSQTAFFMLLNMYAGVHDGRKHKICLPLTPEYLGYADQGMMDDMFCGVRPKIELLGERGFKYHCDFDSLADTLTLGEASAEKIVALCVSRPTNPSGNVISDSELDKLGALADAYNIPLIVDCAYGDPFPGLVYTDCSLTWQANRIFVFSLSKLGLPGARTGIVVADKSVIEALTNSNTVISLASGNLGPAIMQRILAEGELNNICEKILKPFYKTKREFALSCIARFFEGVDYRVHASEGAFFLWLWFPSMNTDSTSLYQRLKQKDVLVMDGKPFFFEHDDWLHANQCIRVNFCADDAVLEKAMSLISQEVIIS